MSLQVAEKPEPLLEVVHLKKYYPIKKKSILSRTVGHVKAVDDISFSVYPGETLGLVGESGCGKSTTGRSIIKLDDPTDGKVFFKQKNLADLSSKEMRKLRTELQIIFQDPYSSLNPRKRVGDLLAERPLKAHKLAEGDEVEKKRSMTFWKSSVCRGTIKAAIRMNFPVDNGSGSGLPAH
ncbi:ATP-binding cassette domain-containing protein [Terrilactibacillus sp. S3-3]|nr:ATP-binding cassette domain-containing protein [Terrilactibacillus sp. S3-3]